MFQNNRRSIERNLRYRNYQKMLEPLSIEQPCNPREHCTLSPKTHLRGHDVGVSKCAFCWLITHPITLDEGCNNLKLGSPVWAQWLFNMVSCNFVAWCTAWPPVSYFQYPLTNKIQVEISPLLYQDNLSALSRYLSQPRGVVQKFWSLHCYVCICMIIQHIHPL